MIMNPKREENKMTPYLKRYRMKITAIGPIHVGDGKKLKKIEYIYDKQNNTNHFYKISFIIYKINCNSFLKVILYEYKG